MRIDRCHPTYRCGICRSLLVMGEPHSHRRTNRVVRSVLGTPPIATDANRQQKLTPQHALKSEVQAS
jgi:hypothetical protein